jgi:UDP-glucose 4-epimerase
MTKAFEGARVLITRGLGFIGSNLARRLNSLGADITIVDSLIPDYGGNRYNIEGIEDRLKVNMPDANPKRALKLESRRHRVAVKHPDGIER